MVAVASTIDTRAGAHDCRVTVAFPGSAPPCAAAFKTNLNVGCTAVADVAEGRARVA